MKSYFWATRNGVKLDLLLVKNGGLMGVECKRMDAPRLAPLMRIAAADLKPDRLPVVYFGKSRHTLSDRIMALPSKALDIAIRGL